MKQPRIAVDVETYPNVFTIAAEHCEFPICWGFEISPWRNDSREIIEWFHWVKQIGGMFVTFNGLAFDWPVMDLLLKMGGRATTGDLYAKAMEIIKSQDGDRFSHTIYPKDRFIPILDEFKLHHFDNRAKATSLKAIEFNMRMDSIEDLPFPVGTILTQEQTFLLRKYNAHDVTATKDFYHHSAKEIAFREELATKYNKDFLNFSDVKIGKEIFQMALENRGISCYDYDAEKGRTPRQTKRPVISLNECIPNYIRLETPEFKSIIDYLRQQNITETKGVFTDLKVSLGGINFVFGTGGIHASVENETFIATEEMMIADVDVTGMYPAIAIANKFFPEHLGEGFISVYEELRDERTKHKKGTATNAILKLAMNGVYGASNEKFSIFFDPKFTMSITLTGQLSLAMLVEQLLRIEGLRIIQSNTDGITCYLPRNKKQQFDQICKWWEAVTKLQLEEVEYSRIHIRDVNGYIAVDTNGKVKRKGAYQYDVEWHQNASSLVVQKVAEKFFLENANIRDTLAAHPDKMDFMLRVKVPRSSHLIGVYPTGERQLENTLRYYVSEGGCNLVKVMPPLAKKPDQWRRIGVESGWTVCPCNNIKEAILPINFAYYEREVEKLVLGMR